MRKYLITILLFLSTTYSQTIDTLNFASNDSIDIRGLVQNQIKDALKKKSFTQQSALQSESYKSKSTLGVSKINLKTTNDAKMNLFPQLFTRLPFQYKIFLSLSSVIVLYVLVRRFLLQFKRKSTKKFKERIALLREEKIGGSIINNKKRQIRIKLKDNPIALKQNEHEISINAKQLNISKGELLLAARLKLLEVSKAQRSL